MKRQFLFLVLHLVPAVPLLSQDFKVVGYLPYYRFDLIDQIDFTKITHLNLAFLNPDIDGNLSVGGRDIAPVISMAKQKNPDVVIFISIAGGGLTEEWAQAYDKFLLPEYRAEFAQLLVEYVKEYDLDGIDVDLEWGHVNEYYSPFVLLLADSLRFHSKQITAALPAIYRYPDLSQEAIETYDFINLMVYDKTGPWAPNNPGPHAPRDFATQSIDFWRNQGLADEKMTLGVPFYGYDFTDQSNVTAFTFGSMVGENRQYAYSDQVGEKYYNGIPTIQYKTLLALNEVSGIMIWELGQDAFGINNDLSLLSAIDFVIQTGTLPITGVENILASSDHDIHVFPNPFQDDFCINMRDDITNYTIRVLDMKGREYPARAFDLSKNMLTMDYSEIPTGLYVLHVEINGIRTTKKILKM